MYINIKMDIEIAIIEVLFCNQYYEWIYYQFKKYQRDKLQSFVFTK